MSFHWCDNLHTAVFSPRDYQVELLAAAFERNTMICLGHKSSKEFIALKLLQELGRGNGLQKTKISIYLSVNSSPAIYNMLLHLTDLRVYQETTAQNIDLPQDYHAYILHPKILLNLLTEKKIKMHDISLLVIEDCHHDGVQCDIKAIFKDFYNLRELRYMPKVLGLAGPLHSASCALGELSAMLNSLENTVQCKTESASDIVTVLRYCSKPFEYIVQCAPYKQSELCFLLQDILLTRKAFLINHRYDPFEIYSTDEFLEELEDIPDPKKEPLDFLDIMLQILLEMGPWSADRVAFNVYQRIEKQKIKTPHERHYILLCLVNTALLEVHSICEQNFRKFKNKDCIENYSSPKVLRLLEVLRLFQPDDTKSKNDTMKRISLELEKMDFQKLTRILETKCHSVEQAVEKQQLESRSIVENLDSVIKPDFHTKISEKLNMETDIDNKTVNNNIKTDDTITFSNPHFTSSTNRRQSSGHNNNRPKRRQFRRYRDQYDAADTLCSIIFCNSNYTARVLFELLAELSRHDPSLKFIKCQYTTDRLADPITEPKEAESEHRRQEEVLKRFRMHDCNILIGTSILEEGIDVPKCNLVIRWDPPTTYRSYVQCKGKARAVPAYHILLVASSDWKDFTNLTSLNEQINDKSHRLVCSLEENKDKCINDPDNSDKGDDDNTDEEESKQINGVSIQQQFVYGCSKGTVKILNPEVITKKHPSKLLSTSSDIILKEINDKTSTIENIQIKINNDFQTNQENADKMVLNTSILEEGNCTLKNSTNLNNNIKCRNSVIEAYDIHQVIHKSNSTSKINDSLNKSNYTVFDIDEILNDTGNSQKDKELHCVPNTKVQKKSFCLRNDLEHKVDPLNSHTVDINQFENMDDTKNIIIHKRNITNMVESRCEKGCLDKQIQKPSSLNKSDYTVFDIDKILNHSNKSKKDEELNCVQNTKVQKNSFVLFNKHEHKLDSEIRNTVDITQIENMDDSPNIIIDKSNSTNMVESRCQKDCLEKHIEKPSLLKKIDYNVFDIDEILNDTDNSTKTEEQSCVQNTKVYKKFSCLLHDCDDKVDSENSNTVDIKQFENMNETTNVIVEQLAEYREIEKMLLQKCANVEPQENEHKDADMFNNCVKPYKPLTDLLTGASVDLSNSIALVNKYCAKLPSDTFTKLTPLWRCAHTIRNDIKMYQYTLRLPINSPLKYDIVGLPMPTEVLARRMAALQACIALHTSGELDDNLQPIGKEGFRAIESDWENFELEEEDEQIVMENSEPRPGTTKRRQYYYKRIASEFCDCRPVVGELCYLYLLDLTLQCPIPEEQNTRGRKIYPPEDALQGFGILTLKKIPKVSSFPIFTRSGEVKVSLVLHPQRVALTEKQISCINAFINYTFSKVLRLKKFLMLFDPESTENCVFIVPTIKTANGNKSIDWKFLELIEQNASMMPTAVPEEERHCKEFSAEKFNDAVVMPWYRNQDQPHYFYVAEICHQLSPLSAFPSKKYQTFMHYYYLKYGLKIHSKQPLLDVDHTSARLNFLTPRYVNRKGVALPTSSEATKRAKRENLELKQILVPELCTVHPFPASLWRTAVCLPCILYRINGLLLADDIRKKVVRDMGLGQIQLTDDKDWPMLDFGWSLSDVLKKTKANRLKNADNIDGEQSASEDKNESLKDADMDADELLKSGKQDTNLTDMDCNISDAASGFVEIGTWSNEMAENLEDQRSDFDTDEEDFDEVLDALMVVNYKISDKAARATSPTFTDIQLDEKGIFPQIQNRKTKKQEPVFAYYDSDTSYAESNYDSDVDMIDDSESSDEDNIVITSKNEAETIETEQDIEKLNKQLLIIQASKANDRDYQETKNLKVGYNFLDIKHEISENLKQSIDQFEDSIKRLIYDIRNSGMLVGYDCNIKLPAKTKDINENINHKLELCLETYKQFIPYASSNDILKLLNNEEILAQALNVYNLQALNLNWLKNHPEELYTINGCGDLFDNFNDSENLLMTETGEKQIRIDFESQGKEYETENETKDFINAYSKHLKHFPVENFSFDYQPDLSTHPGPSPSIILQGLTMSNANDGINLERLETIGDSFLKYAITTYLYITYENVHEGKLSHLRSKQVANLNLYRLGRRKLLGEYMIATKFEPSDNWLPPCYYVPKELEKALIEAKIPPHYWSLVDLVNIKKLTNAEICDLVRKKADEWGCNFSEQDDFEDENDGISKAISHDWDDPDHVPVEFSCFIPYNLVSQHSIPDKSVADCVEALIGAYLIECGLRGALLFMAWLGIRVIPYERVPYDAQKAREPGTTLPDREGMITVYGSWSPPKSPLLHYTPNAEKMLVSILDGYDEFEKKLGYKFRDRSYLLQAMTHASYTPNRLTDCYQRLEFLGDAVLDYLITRHLYEDPRQHSPGALTDLRSALVNNTIFASLAVRHGFHKYFRHLSPGLNEVIDRFVRIQTENGHSISEEYYLLSDEECDDAEDVEVPKALGDVFESVAGAIFLDSNMSLDAVWLVYYNIMRPEIEQFSNSVPKSPIRELLELEPETAKFGKPEKLADGRRVRVTVEVFCKGTYRGIGRNYRIAKCTAAKCALRHLKKMGLIEKRI